jgi:dTDP-4-amino-4,6-dideoxy-D-galactose acyltransferase
MNAEPFAMLPWDSAFFGFPTARILIPGLDTQALREVLAELAQQNIRLAYWTVDPADAASNRSAAACGGFLADVRRTYLAEPPLSDPSRKRHAVATFRDRSEEVLLSLAVEAGRFSRYRVDPAFPQSLFRALYEEWMRKSLSGEIADEVLVAEAGGEIVGTLTVQARQGAGNIGLVAVDPRHQGTGAGSSLIQAAAEWFIGKDCVTAKVATQESNSAACALYEKNGYRLVGREHVHHFWPLGK